MVPADASASLSTTTTVTYSSKRVSNSCLSIPSSSSRNPLGFLKVHMQMAILVTTLRSGSTERHLRLMVQKRRIRFDVIDGFTEPYLEKVLRHGLPFTIPCQYPL